MPAGEGVEQPVLHRHERVQEEDLERRQRERGGGECGERVPHRFSASTSASAWNRSTEASISSLLMETLSTFTPSGMVFA